MVHDIALMHATLTQEGKPMNLATLLQNIQFVTDAQGQKQAVQIDLDTWEMLVTYLEDATTEELLTPNLIAAIEQSRQRIKRGEFISYQVLKRDV